MKNRVLFISSILLTLLVFTNQVYAQAYTAKKMSTSQLIKLAAHESSPIVFDYELVKKERVLNFGTLDFLQVYNIDFDTFVENMRKAYKTKKEFAKLEPSFHPSGKIPKLYFAGLGRKPVQATLGAKDLYYKIRFLVQKNENPNYTNVIVKSSISSMVYGGAIPVRSPFRPVSAKSVAFRWN